MESTRDEHRVGPTFVFGALLLATGVCALLERLQIIDAVRLAARVLLDLVAACVAVVLWPIGAITWPLALILAGGLMVWHALTRNSERTSGSPETSHVK